MGSKNGETQGTSMTNGATKPAVSEIDDFTPRYLDAAELTFTRSEVGTARLETIGSWMPRVINKFSGICNAINET